MTWGGGGGGHTWNFVSNLHVDRKSSETRNNDSYSHRIVMSIHCAVFRKENSFRKCLFDE